MPLIHVKDIDDEMMNEYVQLIEDGLDPGSAARELGSTGHQFRKLRSPNSQWYMPGFAAQVESALNSGPHPRNRLERLREHAWKAIEDGNIRMLEKFMLAYDPDFEKLRHSNLRVDGEIKMAVRQMFPGLSEDDIDRQLAEIQARRLARDSIKQLPPPQEAA